MTDYMDHQIQFLRDKKYVDLQPDSVIPVPRDRTFSVDSLPRTTALRLGSSLACEFSPFILLRSAPASEPFPADPDGAE